LLQRLDHVALLLIEAFERFVDPLRKIAVLAKELERLCCTLALGAAQVQGLAHEIDLGALQAFDHRGTADVGALHGGAHLQPIAPDAIRCMLERGERLLVAGVAIDLIVHLLL